MSNKSKETKKNAADHAANNGVRGDSNEQQKMPSKDYEAELFSCKSNW